MCVAPCGGGMSPCTRGPDRTTEPVSDRAGGVCVNVGLCACACPRVYNTTPGAASRHFSSLPQPPEVGADRKPILLMKKLSLREVM